MRERIKDRRGRSWWILAICLAISLIVAIAVYFALQERSARDIERVSELYSERTGNVINSVFRKTDVLATVIKLKNGDLDEATFDEVARIMYEPNSGIRGIQSMPNAVVTYSYPLEGNEGVMGKNFFDIPERRDDVLLAVNTKSIALSGPYYLIQGGLGVVARNPVFLDDASGNEYFWGFSTIVLDLPDVLAPVALDRLPDVGYDYQLFSINEIGERIVIQGDADLDTTTAICGTIEVPHHEWTLAIVPLKPWRNLLQSIGILLVGVALSILIWRLYCMMLRERAATQAKDRFFSDISHDMRTPLNAVIGFSDLVRTPDLSVDQKDEYLNKIRYSGEMLLDLVNDTLSISKAENGKLRLNLRPVATDTIENAVSGPIREMAEQKGVSLTVDRSGYRAETILADFLNVEKIFLNLLGNAVKFTPAGGHIQVTIRSEKVGDEGIRYLVVIEDDGIGIGASFLPHIFEPFSQEQRKGYEGTGTGLGLAIVRQLVDLMGGEISVESEEGKGTEFEVSLEFEVVSEDIDAIVAQDDGSVDSALGGKRVLLCEDNAINREVATKTLEREHMIVEEAADGKDGVERFVQSPIGYYDCVLMDLRMPVMDGYAATQAIRSLGRSDATTVPIIAMTADAFGDDVKRCLDVGMDAHVAKPVDPKVLFATLRRFM